jgi:hypothetical protein
MNRPKGEVPSEVPPHDVRQFLAEKYNTEFVAYHSVEEASQDPQAAVVLSGDYGGTIFLTVPVARLRCDLGTLQTLVSDLDAVTYMSGDLTIATVALERHTVGTGVLGGDGGGAVVDGVWTHPSVLPREIRDQAAEVVLGLRPRIDRASAQGARTFARTHEGTTTRAPFQDPPRMGHRYQSASGPTGVGSARADPLICRS